MKHISDITSEIDFNPFQGSKDNFDEQDALVINNLFLCLQSIFPAFKQAWPNNDLFEKAKKEWTKAFSEAKLNDIRKIKIGISKYRLSQSPFVPTPGQFIEMCNPTPKELGIPGIEDAYKEACYNSAPTVIEKKWSHQVVYHAWSMTGSNIFISQPSKQSAPIFERNYKITIRMILNNEPLKEIPLAIDAPKAEKSSKDKAAPFFKDLYAMIKK